MERCTETQKDGMKGGRKESRGEKEKGEEEVRRPEKPL